MIEVSGLHYRPRGREILKGLDMSLSSGKVTAFLGPNGAGKSTFLRILAGHLPPSEGEVRLKGKPLQGYAKSELARSRAVLSQHQGLPFEFSVESIVLLGRSPFYSLRPGKEDRRVVEEVMQELGLWELRHRGMHQLSGGERQKVHLARVMAQIYPERGGDYSGRLLFMDEPTTWLDVHQQHQLLERVRLLSEQGLTVIMVLHELDLASRYADFLTLMKSGRILAHGAVKQVFTDAWLSEAYGMPLHVCSDDLGNVHCCPLEAPLLKV